MWEFPMLTEVGSFTWELDTDGGYADYSPV